MIMIDRDNDVSRGRSVVSTAGAADRYDVEIGEAGAACDRGGSATCGVVDAAAMLLAACGRFGLVVLAHGQVGHDDVADAQDVRARQSAGASDLVPAPRSAPSRDDRPARRVDDERCRLHQRQLVRADQAARPVAEDQVDGDHVGGGQAALPC